MRDSDEQRFSFRKCVSWPRRHAVAAIAIILMATVAHAQFNSPGACGSARNPCGPVTGNGAGGATLGSSGAAGALSGADTGKLGALAAQYGFSSDDVSRLQQALSQNGGTLTNDQMDQIAARLAARGVSDADLSSIASALGLSDSQLAQIRSRLAAARAASNPQSQPSQPGVSAAANQQSAPSAIEKAFAQRTAAATAEQAPPTEPGSEGLSQFGYAVFSSQVSTFAPVGNVPVGNDYIIGPGDELLILMWGRINQTFGLTVARDGAIQIPEMGPLQVAGLTFAQAKQLIQTHAGQITGVQVDVTMGNLRTIEVFVMGEVQQPGAYTISALSTISNALVAAGGITKVGSLRNVQLRRHNQVVRTLDLYNLLLRGDRRGDERLEPDDVVFVPVIGAVAGVAGGVKRPAIYELRGGGASIKSLIDLAGGISAEGYAQRIQVERIETHKRMIALDMNFDQLEPQNFEVRDGDLVKIFPVLPGSGNIVNLLGSVRRPGEYQWYQGMRVADAIEKAEGIAPKAFLGYAMIKRLVGPTKVVHVVPVDLTAALTDHLGSVANIALSPGDEITIFSEDQIRELPTVAVTGEVRTPGPYPLSQGMRVSDLIYLAGGLKDDAYLVQAELARTQVVNGDRTHHSYIDLDLRQALAGADLADLDLLPNDQLFVRLAPGWHLPWVVTLKGRVTKPGPYTIQQGDRLSDVFQRCGGVVTDAYLPATIFIRASVRELEQKSLDESRQRLQSQLTQAQFAQLQLSPSGPGINPSSGALSAEAILGLRQLLDQTQDQQAQGRLVMHLRTLDDLSKSPENVLLEDQDDITIPRKPSSVNVLGQVFNPAALVYQPSLTVRDYLQRAGGASEGADKDHIFVIKADGSVLTDEGIKNGKGSTFPLLLAISGGLMAAHLEPGDTVFVPERVFYENNIRTWAEITQIVANSAQGLAVLGILATNL